MTYNKQPITEKIIRFQDCDPFGHLNNSKYLDYMINAREDHLIEEYGLNIFNMAKQHGKSWVVGHSEIVYLKPAVVMEKVKVQSRLIDFSDRSVKAEIVMLDSNEEHIKAVLWSKFVHYDLKALKSTAHSADLSELLEKVHVPIEEQTLELRVKKLVEEVRQVQKV